MDYDALAGQLGGRSADAPVDDYDALASKFGGRAAARAAQVEERYDPTAGMSGTEKALAGAGKAAVDLWRGIKQIAGIGDQEALQKEIDESKRLDAPLMDSGAGLAGNLAGSIATTFVPGAGMATAAARALPTAATALKAASAARPLTAAVGTGAASGAATSALGPVASDETRAENAALGAVGGAMGGAVARGVGRAVSGFKLPSERLLESGVRVTPGRAAGGALQRLEEGIESIPLVGDVVKGAHRRSVEDFNRAAINKTLESIGQKLEKGDPVGREAIGKAEQMIGDAYKSVLGKIKIVKLDNEFVDELGNLAGMTSELSDSAAKQFERIVDRQIFQRMTPAGTISADTMKIVESELGRIGRGLRTAQDFDQRQLGDAILEVQASLRGAVERSAPQHAKELRNVNEAFAKFVRVQRAASSVAAEDGVFSPSHLLSAVKAEDKSRRKGAFARGDALLQDFAEDAKKTLGSKVPDSGSPYRTMAAIAGLGGTGAYFDLPPELALLAAPYTRPGRAATLAMLSKRPEVMRQLGAVIQRGAPVGGIGGASLLTSE